MKSLILGTILTLFVGHPSFGQAPEPAPKFEAVDIHVSPKTTNAFVRTAPPRGERYEVKNATMVDLIRIAYGFDLDKILAGPSWLELDRFDVIGKLPRDSTPETQKQMLESALTDRFKLVVHKETKPLPTHALTVGKKHQLKEAGGTEEPGCKPQTASGTPAEGGVRLFMTSGNGAETVLSLGPGMTIQFQCRNMTMAGFAVALRSMIGANLGPNPILDETGLEGKWNFDLKYSMGLNGPMMDAAERISISTAIEKQLGLKLEDKPVPTPVLVVDSVNRTPGENPPGVADALPPIPLPKEFEVASIKPADASSRMSRFQMQPGGRLVVEGMPLRFLITRAFNTNFADQLVGLPEFASTERYNITAKTPGGVEIGGGPMDMDAMAPLILSLLVDRFKMTYHREERPLPAYSLVAAKPKMKKADPATRTSCKYGTPPPGAPPGSRFLTCQNSTMEQLVERLMGATPELTTPVADATGIEGGWDFSLMFSMRMPAMMAAGGGRGGDAGPGTAAMPSAADPVAGYSVFEAVEKQLGLKLEKQKRPISVIVIDHLEQKPTDN